MGIGLRSPTRSAAELRRRALGALEGARLRSTAAGGAAVTALSRDGQPKADAGRTRAVYRNTIWLVAGESAARGSRFLLALMVARYLGAEDFGRWSFALAFATLVAIASDFGLSTMTVRDLSADRRATETYLAQVATLKAALGLAAAGLVVAAAPLFTREPASLLLTYALGFALVVDIFGLFLYSFFRAQERMEFEALCKVLGAAAIVVAGAGLVWAGAPLLAFGAAYALGVLLATAAGLKLVFARVGRLRAAVDLPFWRRTARSAVPFFVSGLGFYLYSRVDVLMLSTLAGDRATGLYNAAYSFLFTLTLVPTLFASSLFPHLASRRSAEELAGPVLRATGAIAVYALVTAALFFLTRRVIYLGLFGPEYAESLRVFTILLGGISLSFFSILYYFVLYARRREGAVLTVTVAGLGLNVLLNSLLIPRYGAEGAAVTTLLTETFVLCSLLACSVEVLGHAWRRREPREAGASSQPL